MKLTQNQNCVKLLFLYNTADHVTLQGSHSQVDTSTRMITYDQETQGGGYLNMK